MHRPLALCLAALVLLGACGGDEADLDGRAESLGPAPEGIEGVEEFDITDNRHVEGAVDYAPLPPVGGPHNPVPANCGFYDDEVPNENAAHTLEHGAVWITYDASADPATLETLQAIAGASDHILVSRYDDQDSPLVLTAWNRQLKLDSVDDPRVEEFINTYLFADTAPEPGASCSGGAG